MGEGEGKGGRGFEGRGLEGVDRGDEGLFVSSVPTRCMVFYVAIPASSL